MIEPPPKTAPTIRRTRPGLFIGLALLLALLLALSFVIRGCMPAAHAEKYYVADQVILSGPANEIDQVVIGARQQLGLPADALLRVERVPLEYLSQLPASCPGLPAASQTGQLYVVDQYKIGGRATVAQVIRELQAQGQARNVSIGAEPNYLTGRKPIAGSPWTIGGSPWTIGGSPWTIGGSPWTIGGSPWTIGGSPSGSQINDAAGQAFEGQWAFGSQGIHRKAGLAERRNQGQGVRVGVFDTSPFPVSVSSVTLAMTPTLELKLLHPMPGGRLTPDSTAPDMRDHGLFSAGLVHAVAPQSEIQLIRVLDDTAQGDLQTLNRALDTFISEVLQARGELQGAVINLSLGVHPPPEAEKQGLPTEITSLRTVLSAARCAGIVVIAASGNDSAKIAPNHEAAQIPASWDTALGVAASNTERQVSCFSNQGEMTAPGGDGGPKPKCQQRIQTCIAPNDCAYALIGLSLTSPLGYTYWNGTSFAAPLVSGAAALVLGGDGPAQTAVAPSGGYDRVEEVFTRLKNSAASGSLNLTQLERGP